MEQIIHIDQNQCVVSMNMQNEIELNQLLTFIE